MKTCTSCGHQSEFPCPSNNIPPKCKIIVMKSLPCGHRTKVQCSDPSPKCDLICLERLPCGHPCDMNCHEGRTHSSKCLYPCSKPKNKCYKNHPCSKLCHQICNDCNEVIKDVELVCGHQAAKIKCSQIEAFVCFKKCQNVQNCKIGYCYEHNGVPCNDGKNKN
jgi:hypothetical protein